MNVASSNEAHHSSTVSPICRIPAEVLTCIFESFVFYVEQSPWELVLVSRQWKNTALGTHRLWSKILITVLMENYKIHSIGGEVGKVRSHGNFQVCSTVDELDRALARSGATLLDVRIHQPIIDTPSVVSMCIKVLSKPINSRLQALVIDGRMSKNPLANPIVACIESSYPALISIDLDVPDRWGDGMLPRLLKGARRVRSIRSKIPQDLNVSIVDWENIQSLDVMRMREAHVFNRFCDKLHSLRTLNGVPDNWPNDSTPSMSFNFLSTVHLVLYAPHGLCELQKISFPVLTRLDLEIFGTNHAITLPSSSWKLPLLSELNVNAENIPQISQWLASVDIPRLQRLHLDVYEEDGSEHFPRFMHYPNIHSISIVANSLADQYFIDALEAIPSASIVFLSYKNNYYQLEGVRSLLTRLLVTGSRMLCPHVTAITIQGDHLGLTCARDPLERLIRRIVESRAESLESFTVSWAGQMSFIPDIVEYVNQASYQDFIRKKHPVVRNTCLRDQQLNASRAPSRIRDITIYNAPLYSSKEDKNCRINHLLRKRQMSNPRATIAERPESATFITPSMSTTPISRLPTEVLGYIFEQYVLHLAKSPWNLVLVSRQWKEIALAAPYLWSNIIVTSSTPHNDLYGIGGEIITQANFQVCRTLGELDLALVRSGATLLNIVIDYRYQDIENPVSDVMLARVIAKPVNDRLQKLYVSIREPTSFEPEQITKYIEHSYSSLIAIDIDVPDSWYQVLVSPLLKAKNRLQSIRTQIPDDIDISTLNWSSLQSLDLDNTPVPIFNRFCHRLQNLRILEGIPSEWPDTSTPLTTLTQLPNLTLVGRSPRYPYNLSCLSLPNLKELYLCFFKLFTSDPVAHEDKASFSWSLPSLVRLSLDVNVPGISGWLSSVDTPNLDWLSITSWIGDETDHFPSSIVFPNLRHLSIQTDYGSGDYYIGALEAAPNVSEAILLSRSNINPDQRGSTLLARLSETGARTLCPRLTRVTIDGGFSGLVGARKIFDPIIERVVASRIAQLESFMVTWADDETRYIPLSVDYVEQLSQ